jgi:hypothetical protein
MIRLLSAAQNGNGLTHVLSPIRPAPGTPERFQTLYVYGTFDGATVSLEVRPKGVASWFDCGIALTAKGAVNVECNAYYVRAVVAGGGGSESITAELAYS